MSSLARAFTLRRKRNDSTNDAKLKEDSAKAPSLPRAASMKYSKKPVDPKKISGPVQLLSTTNMLTYNAPDIAVVQAQRKAASSVSSGSSRASSDESDASSTLSRTRDTQLTDVSSVGSVSPEASPSSDKKMTFEITPAVKGAATLRRSLSNLEVRRSSLEGEDAYDQDFAPDAMRSESPAIPQRHPSHSKRAHSELARKRSLQGMSAPAISRNHSFSSISSTQKDSNRSSIDYSSNEPHPFGKELEQLDEVVEEFSGTITDADIAADLQAMRQYGLVRFCASDYMDEIQPLFGHLHGFSASSSGHLSSPNMAWI